MIIIIIIIIIITIIIIRHGMCIKFKLKKEKEFDRLFQKRVVRTKLDVYVFLLTKNAFQEINSSFLPPRYS
jgi:hypothetical protein